MEGTVRGSRLKSNKIKKMQDLGNTGAQQRHFKQETTGEEDIGDRFSFPAPFVDIYSHQASNIVILLVEHWSDYSERKTEGDGIRRLQNVSKVLSAEEYISAETSSNASVIRAQ